MATVQTEPFSQPLAALALANPPRLAAAEIKRELKAGMVTIEEAVVDERAAVVTVLDLLAAQRGWGRHRASQLLARKGAEDPANLIGYHKRIRELTVRQRALLAEWTVRP